MECVCMCEVTFPFKRSLNNLRSDLLFWDLSCNTTKKFYTLWCKCIRQLLGLPVRTHSRYLPMLVDDLPIDAQLYKRLNKFLCQLTSSNNFCVQLCLQLLKNGSNNVCKSVLHIAHQLKVPNHVIFGSSLDFRKHLWF